MPRMSQPRRATTKYNAKNHGFSDDEEDKPETIKEEEASTQKDEETKTDQQEEETKADQQEEGDEQ